MLANLLQLNNKLPQGMRLFTVVYQLGALVHSLIAAEQIKCKLKIVLN